MIFMMIPQSHMNKIILKPNFISGHIFLSNFFDNNAIQFYYFLEMFYKLLVSKKREFCFWNSFIPIVKSLDGERAWTEQILEK